MSQTVSNTEKALNISAPFRLWRRAGFNGMFYAVALIAIGILIRSRVEIFTVNELRDFLGDLKTQPSSISTALMLTRLILWIPIVPIVLAACLVPVRLVWIYGHVTMPDAVSQTIEGLRVACVMVYLAMLRLVYVIVPLAAMFFLYYHMQDQGQSKHFLNMYIAMCAILSIPIIMRGTPIICAVPMAIVSSCPPMFAVQQSQFVIEGKVFALTFIIFLTSLFTAATAQAYLQLPNGSAQQMSAIVGCVIAAAYCLTGLAMICMQSLADYSRRMA